MGKVPDRFSCPTGKALQECSDDPCRVADQDRIPLPGAHAQVTRVVPGSPVFPSRRRYAAGNMFPPHPSYMVRGEGNYLYDLDGNRILDFTNNATTLITDIPTPRSPKPFGGRAGGAPVGWRPILSRWSWPGCSAAGCPRSTASASAIRARKPTCRPSRWRAPSPDATSF